MEKENCLINCLAATQSFSLCLMCSILSSKGILQDETKQAAEQFVLHFKALMQLYPDKFKFSVPVLTEDGVLHRIINADIKEIINRNSDFEQVFSCLTDEKGGMGIITAELRMITTFCLSELGSNVSIPHWNSLLAEEYKRNWVRWEAHLPPLLLFQEPNPTEYLKQISGSETIVVVGDIRKSQDLMTYAASPEDYSNNLVEFMTKTRDLVLENNGILDKFTGDGFIAYFNKELCSRLYTNFVNCFLKFVLDEQEYTATSLFPKWVEGIRKYPSAPIGLSIGADFGKVYFHDIQQHFVAVGDSIVWATRMCAGGEAGEILANNLLYHTLKKKSFLAFSDKMAQTKSGESFLARRIEFMNRNEIDNLTPNTIGERLKAWHNTDQEQ